MRVMVLDGGGALPETMPTPTQCRSGESGEADMTYTIICCKARATVTGTLAEAIKAARAMDAEFQPAFGVRVEDEAGETVAEVNE